jgi:hypothetical protein
MWPTELLSRTVCWHGRAHNPHGPAVTLAVTVTATDTRDRGRPTFLGGTAYKQLGSEPATRYLDSRRTVRVNRALSCVTAAVNRALFCVTAAVTVTACRFITIPGVGASPVD